MDYQEKPSDWAAKDVTLPLFISGMVIAVLCTILCAGLVLSRDYLTNDLAPRLGLVEPTPTPVLCPSIPAGWKLVVNDNFYTNHYGWYLKEETYDIIDSDLTIADGLLRWDIKAKDGVFYFHSPNIKSYPDYYLSTEVRKVSGPQDANYGLAFRIDGEQLLFFSIYDSGAVYVHVRDKEGNWSDPLTQVHSQNIKIGESNKLVVFEQDDHYTFCINEEIVGEVTNSDHSYGEYGIAVSLNNAGDEAVLEYDDFIIWSPTK